MKRSLLLQGWFAFAILAGVGTAAMGLKSGPQVGDELTATFEPMNVTGPDAGETTCILCEYGASPVVLVFARDLSEPVTRLIKRLDVATGQHQTRGLASSVIFLSKEKTLVPRIKEFAAKERIQRTILRSYPPEGPKGYNVAPDADVTVILFVDRFVKANHALKRGELNDKAIDAIIGDIAKILPKEH
ncbi:hypothetical protein AYO44_03950 [Planctomycetaceae bacterium SCGC AG-212-F19]|nr:hypothetical protein AYO44_03950 [Planctomycetaceae bacterium SCGC AG-212-F19]